MICFEVKINDKYVCTAGVGESGVLSAIVTWVKNSKADPVSDDMVYRESLDIHIGGLAQLDADTSQHVDWLNQALSAGDKITIRVIESTTCDEPTREKPRFEGCSFCGKKPLEKGRLIAGSRVFICNECVDALTKQFSEGKTEELSEDQLRNTRCAFCDRAASEVAGTISGLNARICNECLGTCNFILGKSITSSGEKEGA
jgi:hypothetical protein